jgi:hypothetical protein
MRTPRTAVLNVALLALLAAIVPVTAAVAGSSGNAKLCKALARVGSLDLEFQEVIESPSWDEVRDSIDEVGPRLNRAWKAVVRRIPDDQRKDARLVARFTKEALVVFGEADSLDEASAALLGVDDAIDAGLASARLEEFSQDECGVSINNEGEL